MILHVRLSAHKREVPGWLAVGDATVGIPLLLHVVLTIIIIDVPILGRLDAIQAQTLKLFQDGLLVGGVQWPDTSLGESYIVGKKGLFLAVTCLAEETADWIKARAVD